LNRARKFPRKNCCLQCHRSLCFQGQKSSAAIAKLSLGIFALMAVVMPTRLPLASGTKARRASLISFFSAGFFSGLKQSSPGPSQLTQAPDGPTGENTLQIYRPDFPIVYSIKTQDRDLAIACLGTLNEDFSQLVTADHPASPGEIVHIFLSGLKGVEPVANGVPNPADHLVGIANPPPLYDPGALEQLFFGLAPGLVGIQQLDVRVEHAASGLFTPPGLSPDFTPTWNCTAPPVMAP